MQKNVALTLVNGLSLARIYLLFVLVRDITAGPEYAKQTALWLTMGLTDYLDGFLARRLNVTTKFGAVLDVLADKAVMITIPLTLWMYRSFPLWAVCLLMSWVLIWIWQARLYQKAHGRLPAARVWGKRTVAAWGLTTTLFVAGWPVIGEIGLLLPAILSGVTLWDYAKANGWYWR